jgi:hypothetical protein
MYSWMSRFLSEGLMPEPSFVQIRVSYGAEDNKMGMEALGLLYMKRSEMQKCKDLVTFNLLVPNL